MNAIELRALHFAYNGSPVLDGINLEVPEGAYLAVLGPNGGGKSTLLKLLLGLVSPKSGTVRVLGRAPGQSGGLIGYLPQTTRTGRGFPITVLDAVILGLVRPGLAGIRGLRPSRQERELGRKALERGDLADQAERSLGDLSGGQRQRAFIARALVSGPRLLLLDEPTASVDPVARDGLLRLLADLNREMTIVMVSHDVSVLSRGVTAVACVNRTLHSHPAPVLTPEIFHTVYGGGAAECCPVDLVTHGHGPHCGLNLPAFEPKASDKP
jgi:zinc transport system ATP-binding protein